MKSIILLFLIVQNYCLFANIEEWNQKANLPASGRHGAIGFSIGNKGYVGMGHINSGPLGNQNFNDLWEYDVATNSWTQKADYPTEGFHYGTSFSHENMGYIGYGHEFYSFSPITNTYTLLQTPLIALHNNTTVNYKDAILLIDYTNFYTYTPETDSWSLYENDDYFYTQVVVERDDKVYAIGYRNFYKWILAEWNPVTHYWDSISYYPDTINQSHICGFELNGNFYFSLGAESDLGTGNANWKYDFNLGNWERLKDFGGAGRRYYTTFEIENKGYICTGTNGTNFRNLWELVPKDTTGEQNTNKPTPKSIQSLPYPNPSTSTITIDLSQNPDELVYSITIYNLQGELVDSKSTIGNQFVIDKNNLSSGLYIYQITLDNELITTNKFQFI